MATNIVSNATVNLTVNGGNSAKKLEELRAKANAISKEITNIQNGGTTDSSRLRALRKEFEQVSKQIQRCQTEIGRTTDVLSRLDKASPKELRQTLNSLKRGLDSIERGSKAWEKQVAMIRSVETELRRVNATIQTTESRWTRMNRWLNDTQTFIMGLAAAVTGLIMAGRKSVNAYADIEESMTDTQKYTGLARKGVDELNDSFKKTDTRLTREQLNLLAQEAGRLGKNTIDTVEGYVEAASVINVALVDLGEGATQTIAKLANIFGIEKALGTKKAMLSIGSAVNVLSQNCTASKPYLVDFAQRMAGIGAQAGLTVPQILAFGAVLDANGQKVEMSATAIQKIIMALANKNKEFSKVLGLDAEQLAKTLNRSAKDGIMMYLEAIKKLSDKTSARNATVAIAPLFKDMGMDAARVATVLSTLANHIDELKWQFGEADKAFREASSASHEFELFNNTAQASIDKAKKKVSELSIELGEKLYPVMKHVYTSSGIFLRVLNILVSFIINHAGTLTALTAAIVAYSIAAKGATIQTKAFAVANTLASGAAKAWKAAVLLCNVALAQVSGNTARASAAMKVLNTVIKANPIGLLVSVLAAAGVAIYNLCTRTDEYKKSLDKAMDSASSFAEKVDREKKEIDRLFGALKGAEKGTKEYDDAKKGIISRYGVYLKGLITEKGEILNLAKAYDRLSFAAGKAARQRGVESAREALGSTYFQEVDNLTEQLRTALRDMGMGEQQLTRLVVSISQSVGEGKDIKSSDFSEIAAFQARNSGMFGNMFSTTPVDILKKIRSNQKDFISRDSKLEAMDSRYFKDIDSKELDSFIEYLSWHLSNPAGENFEIKFDVKSEDVAKIVADIVAENDYPEKDNKLNFDWRKKQEKQQPLTALQDTASQKIVGIVDAGKIEVSEEKPKEEQVKFNGFPLADAGRVTGMVNRKQAEAIIRELLYEKSRRPESTVDGTTDIPDFDGNIPEYKSEKEQEKERKKAEAEAKREALKAKKEFRDGLAAIEAEYKKQDALIVAAYASGEKEYLTYLNDRNEAEKNFCESSREYYRKNFDGIKDIYLEDDKDYQSLLERKVKADAKYQGKKAAFEVERIKRQESFDISQLKQDAKTGTDRTFADEMELQKKIAAIRLQSLRDQQAQYSKGSEQWERLQIQITQETKDAESDIERQFIQKVNEMRKEYTKLSAADRFKMEMMTLDFLYKAGKIKEEEYQKALKAIRDKYKDELPQKDAGKSSAEKHVEDVEAKYDLQRKQLQQALAEGLISQEEFDKRMKALDEERWHSLLEPIKNSNEWLGLLLNMGESWWNVWNSMGESANSVLERIGAAAQATFAVVAAAMQMASQFAQANAEIEINKIEKRYEREAELAQGNTYLTKKLEKEKQQKIAEIKNKASEDSFKMQIIQATATMIQGAMNAYTSTAAIKPFGPVIAPAAAAVALAAGAANLALLKKQQEASAAQGYAEGGYTSPGRKHDVAGVVHAGEWVAPQELLENPVSARVIERLERFRTSGDISAIERMTDFAVRNNTVGSITRQDASRVVATGAAIRTADIMANSVSEQRIPSVSGAAQEYPGNTDSRNDGQTLRQLAEVMGRLAQRLDEPFVTVNTVTGPTGSKRAKDEYDRLMRNKRRKK